MHVVVRPIPFNVQRCAIIVAAILLYCSAQFSSFILLLKQ